MDPVCHTLVGAALAETGLKRRTALGTATLVVGANLPDVDVLAYAVGPVTALWFRRGVTHGLVSLIVLPLVLLGLVLLWDRLVRRRGGRVPERAVIPAQVFLLAIIAIATHPLLDFMNSYGMRWLMPFSGRWFYGDTLFIVDPWVWAGLTAGFVLARRRKSGRPAAAALAGLALYIVAMGTSNIAARSLIKASVTDALGAEPVRIMAAPLPVNPMRRWVVIEEGETYRFGSFDWVRSPRFVLSDHTIERGPRSPVAAAATRGPEVRKFLSWARFPFFVVERRRGGHAVHIGDARYTLDASDSWAAMTVELPD